MKKVLTTMFFCLLIAICYGQSAKWRTTDYNPQVRSSAHCLYPVGQDNAWQYFVYKSNKKVGFLQINVTKQYNLDLPGFKKGIDVPRPFLFTLFIQDTYTKKNYNREVVAYGNHMYIYNAAAKMVTPFICSHLSLGDQVGDMVVTTISKEKFQQQDLELATLQHTGKDIIEKYMSMTGLYYYKNGELEYKLVSARVRRDSYGCVIY